MFEVFGPRDLDFWIPLALLSVSTKFLADPMRFDVFYGSFSAGLVVDKNDRGRRFLLMTGYSVESQTGYSHSPSQL